MDGVIWISQQTVQSGKSGKDTLYESRVELEDNTSNWVKRRGIEDFYLTFYRATISHESQACYRLCSVSFCQWTKLVLKEDMFTLIMSRYKEASVVIRTITIIQSEKVIPVDPGSWTGRCEPRRLWFHMIFARSHKSINAGIYPRINLSGTILNGKVKNFTLRGIWKKIMKLIPINMLIMEKSLVSRRFMSNRQLKGNINRYYGMIAERTVVILKKNQRVRNKSNKEAHWSELLEKWVWKSIWLTY